MPPMLFRQLFTCLWAIWYFFYILIFEYSWYVKLLLPRRTNKHTLLNVELLWLKNDHRSVMTPGISAIAVPTHYQYLETGFARIRSSYETWRWTPAINQFPISGGQGRAAKTSQWGEEWSGSKLGLSAPGNRHRRRRHQRRLSRHPLLMSSSIIVCWYSLDFRFLREPHLIPHPRISIRRHIVIFYRHNLFCKSIEIWRRKWDEWLHKCPYCKIWAVIKTNRSRFRNYSKGCRSTQKHPLFHHVTDNG